MEGWRGEKYGDDNFLHAKRAPPRERRRETRRWDGGEVREEVLPLSCPSLRYSVFGAKIGPKAKLFLSLSSLTVLVLIYSIDSCKLFHLHV